MRQLEHKEINNKDFKVHFSILANNMQSPFNVGSLFRISENLGVEKLYFSGTSIYPPNRKISKTSRATEQFVPFEFIENPLEIIKKLKAENYQIISLEYCDKSIELNELEIKKDCKILLIIGEESWGVDEVLLNSSDKVCHLNMYGKTSSMNVISACTIASYEILKQLRK